MSEKTKGSRKFIALSLRQQNLLRGKVTGLKLKEIADKENYTVQAISRLTRSELGQSEIARLHESTNALFLSEMENLTKEAIKTLSETMQFCDNRTALEAAMFTLKFLSLPLLQSQQLPTNLLEPLEGSAQKIN